MNRKQVLALSLSVLISLGGLANGGAAFATSQNNDKNDDISFAFTAEAGFEDLTFDQFMKGFTTNKIPKEDMKKLKDLYEDVMKLDKDNKFDEADKKWQAFDKVLNKYIKIPSFEEFMKDMPTKKIGSNDMKKLKNLYEDAIKLEKGSKVDEAHKKWEEFDKIFEKYIDEKSDNLAVTNLQSFEDFMKEMPTKKIPASDMNKLKSLYKDITKLEKDSKFDDADKKWTEFNKILDKYIDEKLFETVELPSFDEFIKGLPTKKIPTDDMNKLKSLYKDVIKLEKDNKFDDADKKWAEFSKILEKYMDVKVETMELPSFDEFIKGMPTKKIPTDDMNKLKSLYKDITKLEKDNKLDDSDKKWDEFNKILDKYLEDCNDSSL